MASGRYVKLAIVDSYVAAGSNNGIIIVSEIQVFNPAGTNYALSKTAAASSSYSTNTPDKAVDGNTGTAYGWATASGTGYTPNEAQWITIDLGAVYNDISKFTVKTEGGSGYSQLKAYKVYVSTDNTVWDIVVNAANITSVADGTVRTDNFTVPQTTGKCRTKVSDMQIGDFIHMSYQPNNLFALGAQGVSETPLTGATGSQYNWFYMLKVDRGLLIADRVVENTISWDTLNANKLAQGMPWDGGNIIPTMTSNTAPSGVASASSFANSGFDAWKAFNKTGYLDTWATPSGTSTGWLQYEFANPTCIKQYTIMPYQNNQTYSPKAWTFLGSNDGVNFEVLDRKTNITGWANNTKKIFPFLNNKNYKMYRIDVTESGGIALYIAELEMMETAGIFRCLTGGVAYADVNGNRSIASADASRGGWPTNNEYDKYIVNSNLGGKITAGDYNVWHVNAVGVPGAPAQKVGEWAPDTIDLGIAASTGRTYRGYNGLAYVSWNPTTTSAVSVGFRPVFEYYE